MKIEDIKFKAKRLDNGEWIIGSLIRSTAGVKERAYIVDNFSSMSDYSVVGVDPSTVCQFTGLKDKNGKDVWEGYYLKPINGSKAMKVIYKEGSFGFDTSYRGLRFHPLAHYDIRAGKLVQLELADRKEGEK